MKAIKPMAVITISSVVILGVKLMMDVNKDIKSQTGHTNRA